jgi:hypothetical protein
VDVDVHEAGHEDAVHPLRAGRHVRRMRHVDDHLLVHRDQCVVVQDAVDEGAAVEVVHDRVIPSVSS